MLPMISAIAACLISASHGLHERSRLQEPSLRDGPATVSHVVAVVGDRSITDAVTVDARGGGIHTVRGNDRTREASGPGAVHRDVVLRIDETVHLDVAAELDAS